MASSANLIQYNPNNLFDDLKVLADARSDKNKYLLCLFKNKLSSTIVSRDTREERRSWIAYGMGCASSITRTVGSYLWDNDTNHILDYLDALVSDLQNKISNLDQSQTSLLKRAIDSLDSFSDEYSAKEERLIDKRKVPVGMVSRSNIEGNGRISQKFKDLSNRIREAIESRRSLSTQGQKARHSSRGIQIHV